MKLITTAEWLRMFEDWSIKPEECGTYVAMSYITATDGMAQPLHGPYTKELSHVRGSEASDLQQALIYLERKGSGRVWLDVISARPTEGVMVALDMRKVQETYAKSSVTYAILNDEDSAHLLRVKRAAEDLLTVMNDPKAVTSKYVSPETRLSPSSTAYYEDSHTYWTRIWPFSEMVVSDNFAYLAKASGGLLEVSRRALVCLRDDIARVRRDDMDFEGFAGSNARATNRLRDTMMRDANSLGIHFRRLTQRSDMSQGSSYGTIRGLVGQPRYARNWSSLLDAVSVIDPRLQVGSARPVGRLSSVFMVLHSYGLVPAPTLLATGSPVPRSCMPDVAGAKWSDEGCEFLDGGEVSTDALMRMGFLIGGDYGPRRLRDLGIDFRDDEPTIRLGRVVMKCWLVPIHESHAPYLRRAARASDSISSFDSNHEESPKCILGPGCRLEDIRYVAVRANRYGYIVGGSKDCVFGIVGFDLLSVVGVRMRTGRLDTIVV
jgi:hypothetical protein